MNKIFVYGTLLSGEYNNHLLETSTLLGNDKVTGFSMRNLGPFPACVHDENPDKIIVGEVWEVDDQTFQRLDRLEGYPSFYDRVQVPTQFGDAWMYINENEKDKPEIASGDWKKI